MDANTKSIKTSSKDKDVVNGQNTAMETLAKLSKRLVNGKVQKLKEAENVHANGQNTKEENNKDVVASLESAKETNALLLEESANGLENLSKQEPSREDATGRFMEKTSKERDVATKPSNVKHSKERRNALKSFILANGLVLKLKTLNSFVAENLLQNHPLMELPLSRNVADI
jgi:hypothetical protein